jgi:hypothetical protein
MANMNLQLHHSFAEVSQGAMSCEHTSFAKCQKRKFLAIFRFSCSILPNLFLRIFFSLLAAEAKHGRTKEIDFDPNNPYATLVKCSAAPKIHAIAPPLVYPASFMELLEKEGVNPAAHSAQSPESIDRVEAALQYYHQIGLLAVPGTAGDLARAILDSDFGQSINKHPFLINDESSPETFDAMICQGLKAKKLPFPDGEEAHRIVCSADNAAEKGEKKLVELSLAL